MFTIPNIFLLAAIACNASAKTQIYDNNLTYECTNDDKIIIYGTNKYGSIYAEGTLMDGSQNSMCNVRKETNNSLVIFTISGCNMSWPVNITAMHHRQETNNAMVIGGNEVTRYQLKCNNVRLGGVDISETAHVKVRDALDVTKAHQTEANLSMRIQNTANQTLDSSSDVIIGEKFRLIISSNNRFTFLPRSCNATDGLTHEAHNRPLINDGMTLDATIISNFSNCIDQTYNEMEASLFAFHFLNTNTVSFICVVTVCHEDDNNCSIDTENNNQRMRRSASIESHAQTLKTSINVIDTYSKSAESIGCELHVAEEKEKM